MAITILRLKKSLNKNSSFLHLVATFFVFTSLYWNIEKGILYEHSLFMVPAVFLPGMAMLICLKGLNIELPYLFGTSIAFGFIIQTLNFFVLYLFHSTQYYLITIFLIFIFSSYLIFLNRNIFLGCVKNSSFDFWNLTFYAGLILGLSYARIKFAGPLDESAGSYAWSPILERHGIFFIEHMVSYASGSGSFYYPKHGPMNIIYAPVPGSILAMLNPNGRFPVYFPMFQCFMLGFYSISCMLAACCTRIFNRYTAILASTLYIVYFSPRLPYVSVSFLYFPQHIVLLVSLTLLLTTLVQNRQNHEPSKTYFFIVAMLGTFACLTNHQFLAVIYPTLLIYFSWCILRSQGIWNKVSWVLPITSISMACWYVFQLGKKVYPGIITNGQLNTLEFRAFGNLTKVYPEAVGNEFEHLFGLIFNAGWGFAILGLFWPLLQIFRSAYIHHKPSHVFLWLGILSSLFFGTFIYLSAGGSGIYFYNFSLFFLFVYGVAFLSRRKVATQVLTWMIIIGICIFPQHSKLNQSTGTGTVNMDLYRFGRTLSGILPDGARVLWVGKDPDGDYERFTCSWLVGTSCVYSNDLSSELIFTKTSHIVSNKELSKNSFPTNLDIHLLKTLQLNIEAMRMHDIPANYLNANIKLLNALPAYPRFNSSIYVYALNYHE